MAHALPALRGIVTRHAGQSVVIISHKSTIRLLVCSVLDFDPRGYRDRLDQHPCGLNILAFSEPASAHLVLYNDVTHCEGVPERTATTHHSTWWDSVEAS